MSFRQVRNTCGDFIQYITTRLNLVNRRSAVKMSVGIRLIWDRLHNASPMELLTLPWCLLTTTRSRSWYNNLKTHSHRKKAEAKENFVLWCCRLLLWSVLFVLWIFFALPRPTFSPGVNRPSETLVILIFTCLTSFWMECISAKFGNVHVVLQT